MKGIGSFWLAVALCLLVTSAWAASDAVSTSPTEQSAQQPGSVLYGSTTDNSALQSESATRFAEASGGSALASSQTEQATATSSARSSSKKSGSGALAALALGAALAGGGGSGGGGSHHSGGATLTPDPAVDPFTPPTHTPEPASMALLGVGLAGLAAYVVKRRTRRA